MRAIEVKHISKSYKGVKALDDVSIRFDFGKIYGLLGRNGAGKSTLIHIIANRRFADSGEVTIDGENARENMAVHEKLFCMSEMDLYDRDLKVKEQFKWAARFYDGFDMERAMELSRQFRLDVNKRVRGLSKGYQSIFKLIAALSVHVPYLFFDEPVLGLDANHRELFYRLLLQEAESGERTIILATHLIEEISGLLEEVVFIHEGRVLVQESAETLLDRGYAVSGPAEAVERYCRDKNVLDQESLGGLKVAYVLGERSSLPEGSGLQITGMNLQKLFVKMTGEGGAIDG